MIKMAMPLLVLMLTLASTAPAWAQYKDQQYGDEVIGRSGDENGGGSGGPYRAIQIIPGQVWKGIVDNGLQNMADNTNAPPNEKPPPSGAGEPTYADVPVPPIRPVVFDGRPIRIDLPHDPRRVLIMFRPELTNPDRLARIIGARTRFEIHFIDMRELSLGNVAVALFLIPPPGSLDAVLAALGDIPGVIGAQPQYIYRGSAENMPAVDMRVLQYAPNKLNALAARADGDGTGVTVGLIDTGIDLGQPELADADIVALDVLSGRPVVNLDHGTALAGLMLADNGFDGIAPGVRLISVRTFDSGPDGAAISGSYEIASAIDLAVQEGAKVLNLSFAGPRDPLVMSVLDAAADKGVIFVAAAGNGGPQAQPAYPGAHRGAIAVTATDIKDRVFAGANRGNYIAVAAPGVDVLSPLPEGRFELLSGTSIATAHVTAIVALMLERNPGLDRDAVLDILEASAHDLGEPGHDAEFGAGLADAEAAVVAAGEN